MGCLERASPTWWLTWLACKKRRKTYSCLVRRKRNYVCGNHSHRSQGAKLGHAADDAGADQSRIPELEVHAAPEAAGSREPAAVVEPRQRSRPRRDSIRPRAPGGRGKNSPHRG